MRILKPIILAILGLFASIGLAQNVPAPQIGLSGNVGAIGFPILNSGTYQMPADANVTFSISNVNTSAVSIKITSAVALTAMRTISYPAGRFQLNVENATTGGQSLSICGPSGSCVTVPNDATHFTPVWCDGTNCIAAIVGGGGGTPFGGYTAGALNLPCATSTSASANCINSSTVYLGGSQIQAQGLLHSSANGMITLGDSNTAGFGVASPSTQAWPSLIGIDFGFTPTNVAVTGSRASDVAAAVLTNMNPGDTGNPIAMQMVGSSEVVQASPTSNCCTVAALNAYRKMAAVGPLWGGVSSTAKVPVSTTTLTGTFTADTSFANANGDLWSVSGGTSSVTLQIGACGCFGVLYKVTASGGAFHVSTGGISQTDALTNLTSLSASWADDPPFNGSLVNSAAMAWFTGYSQGPLAIVATIDTSSVALLQYIAPQEIQTGGISGPMMALGGILPSYPTGYPSYQPYMGQMDATVRQIQTLAVAAGIPAPFVDSSTMNAFCDFNPNTTVNCGTGALNAPLHLGVQGNSNFRYRVEAALGIAPGAATITIPRASISSVDQNYGTSTTPNATLLSPSFNIFSSPGFSSGSMISYLGGTDYGYDFFTNNLTKEYRWCNYPAGTPLTQTSQYLHCAILPLPTTDVTLFSTPPANATISAGADAFAVFNSQTGGAFNLFNPGVNILTAAGQSAGSMLSFDSSHFHYEFFAPNGWLDYSFCNYAQGTPYSSLTQNLGCAYIPIVTGNHQLAFVDTTAQLAGNNAFSGVNIFQTAGASGQPGFTLNGGWFSGGTSTTTKPQMLVEPAGAATNNWSTSGTGLGINSFSGFTGNLIDAQANGIHQFTVDSAGNIFAHNSISINGSQAVTGVQGSTGVKFAAATGTFITSNFRCTDASGNEVDCGVSASSFAASVGANAVQSGNGSGGLINSGCLASGANLSCNLVTSAAYATATRCVSTASPASCSGAASGVVQMAGGASSLTVNSSAFSANTTCAFTLDTIGLTAPANLTSLLPPYITARSTGSITIAMAVAPLTNPVNIDFTGCMN